MSSSLNNTGLGWQAALRCALKGSRLPMREQDAATYCRGGQTVLVQARRTHDPLSIVRNEGTKSGNADLRPVDAHRFSDPP